MHEESHVSAYGDGFDLPYKMKRIEPDGFRLALVLFQFVEMAVDPDISIFTEIVFRFTA